MKNFNDWLYVQRFLQSLDLVSEHFMLALPAGKAVTLYNKPNVYFKRNTPEEIKETGIIGSYNGVAVYCPDSERLLTLIEEVPNE